ncbi:MAG: hypothetical protein IK144_11885 [Bacteroidaceae bacterium]|nr:hypothetical protein [Bacteroidaceae bacterium]
MKKIAFSTRYGLEQAVIDLIKTMTRREDKKLNHPLVTSISEWGIDDKGKANVTITYSTGLTEDVYPAYQIGEEVAVAQRYEEAIHPLDWVNKMLYEDEPGWKNKMFVRADLMPHRIRITGIRVERLQDISESDIVSEGIIMRFGEGQTKPFYTFPKSDWDNPSHIFLSAREAFASLIDRISGRGTWQRNPWVFVYEFELIK